jgi:hypothetical protein
MERRLLALWVEALSVEASDGSTLRRTTQLLDALSVICPFTEVPRRGLFVMPLRGPSRFYGGVATVIEVVLATCHEVVADVVQLGVAEGLFVAELAARHQHLVDHDESLRYLQAQPLEVLGRRDLATTGRRLGVHTVGAFAAWPRARVMERFHRQAVVLHALANGEITEGPGQRDATLPARLERERHGACADEQLGFFGGRGAAEIRAREAARRVSRRLGPEAVTVAVLEPGRFPEERGALVPFGAPVSATSGTAPWPGRGGAPAPVTTIRQPAPVAVLDEQGRDVRVSTRGQLSAPVARIGFASGVSASVIWSAGPWLSVERWWVAPRRRAHLQLVTGDGRAVLVMSEAQRWWLVGVYD